MGEALWDSQFTTFFGAGSIEAPGDSGTNVGSVDWDCVLRKLVNLMSHSALPIPLNIGGTFFRDQ
jgi:hypothetical protein